MASTHKLRSRFRSTTFLGPEFVLVVVNLGLVNLEAPERSSVVAQHLLERA